MIIVEGPDNAGKSTLVKQLLALDPALRILHRERFRPERQESIADTYIKALQPDDGDRLRHSHAIADRFFASECIYGPLFREGCRMSLADHMVIRAWLKSYNALVVHCDAPDAVIQKSWAEREQLYDRDPLLIARAYRQRMRSIFYTSAIFPYDWTDPQAEAQRRTIIELHREQQARDRENLLWWSALGTGIGCLQQPALILIAEDMSHFRTNVLAIVMEALHERMRAMTGLKLMPRVYFTSALKGSDRDVALLRSEVHHLLHSDVTPSPMQQTVVTLGRVAHEAYVHIAHALPYPPMRHLMLPDADSWERELSISHLLDLLSRALIPTTPTTEDTPA